MNTALWKYKIFSLLVVVLIAGGCKGISRNRSIIITAEEICKKSVDVHLVGINWSEKEQWENESMTKYWQPNNQLRESAKKYTHVIRFGEEPCEKILSKKEPIQKVWKRRKAKYLFVLADLPGLHQDLPGNADARRLQLPAPDSVCWGMMVSTIKLTIDSKKIVSLTVPKSDCE
jgi:hypothetical protein